MRMLPCAILVLSAFMSGCVAYDPSPGYDRSYAPRAHDRDGDGIANARDRDRDGDGVRNRDDRRPNNPRWY